MLRLHIGYGDNDEKTDRLASYLECGSVSMHCVRNGRVNNKVIYVVTAFGIIPNVNCSLEKKEIKCFANATFRMALSFQCRREYNYES